jgi:hypothetical protein
MSPCKVVFGDEPAFIVSSHLYAVAMTDTFQLRTGEPARLGGETLRHYQDSTVLGHDDDPLFCDRAFGATFGKYLEDGSIDQGTWVPYDRDSSV